MTASLLEQKTLPHSEESERAVLAAILLDPSRHLPATSGRLHPHDFYLERHQRLYEAMLELQDEKVDIDIRTLQARLEQKKLLQEVGGLAYVATLEVDLPDLGRVEHYVEIVKERSLRRRLIAMCAETYRNCQDGGLEAKQALDRAEQIILELGEQAIPRGFVALADAIKGTVFDLEERPDEVLTGLRSGFDDWDALTHGLNPGNLIIVAGRPGMGKCVAGCSEIVDADGSVRTIEEIVQDRRARLLTLGEDHRFQWTSPSAFVDSGIKGVFEVTTRLGRRIKVTATHPFLTDEGWKPLAEIAVGSTVAVPRRIDVFGEQSMGGHHARLLGYLLGDGALTTTNVTFTNENPSLLEDFTDAVRGFGGVRVTASRREGVSRLAVAADEIEVRAARARFVDSLERALAVSGRPASRVAAAAGVSPRSLSAWRRGRSVPTPATTPAVEAALPGVRVPPVARHNGKNTLVAWLTQLGLMGRGSGHKFVPEIVFRAPARDVATFLNRLFATDGWLCTLSSGQVQAGYCSTSERLARQVQHLLLRFGVIAALRLKRVRYQGQLRDAWQLDITHQESILALIERIGIFGKESQIRQAREALQRRRLHSNRDLVPRTVWKLVERELGRRSWSDLAHSLGLRPGYNLHVGKRGFSRQRLCRIAEILDSDRLRALASSDVYWDRIVEIRALGDQQVYDLTIPDTHNFVANDICVHNSSFAVNVAQNIALRDGKSVGIFSLEMSVNELAMRILASESEVPLRKRRPSDRDWEKIHRAARRAHDAGIYIDDSASPTLLEVASKSRRLKLEKGLDLVILDYLQLMQAGGRYENRNLEIGAITRGLKSLAKELAIPVVALSQLSRQPERRGSDHRPQLADLRESGCLTGDTLVPLAESGIRLPIRDLVGRQDFAVWCLDQGTLKIERASVTRAFGTGVKRVYRLTTRLGRVIRATANHRFLAIDGWKRLDMLTNGQRIALPRHVPLAHRQTMSDAEPSLAVLAESDIYWDQVTSIVEDGHDEVFDLTVPGNHNFIANDLFVHNSIEQDADIVAFIYRDEVYNPENEESQGIAELIVAKNRNGQTGTVDLAFFGETTTFRSLSRRGGGP
jgi:replicative DNA helicase